MNKCAPGVSFNENSCFNIDQLVKISKKFNLSHPKLKFDIINNKKYLLKNLIKGMKKTYNCNNEICWLDTKLLKNMNHNIFTSHRPKGPKNHLEWLSTTDINSVMGQYENKNKKFKFLGAVPYDFEDLEILEIGNLNLNNFSNKYNKFGLVINLDEHWKNGSHWVALYGNFLKNQVYFFDSFGKKPYKRIRNFIRKIVNHMYNIKYKKNINYNNLNYKKLNSIDARFNKIQHQFKNTECGVYSMNFIIRLLNGNETFDDITNNITDDNFMNNCRKVYFRN